jgi:hypothetical protein
MSTAEKPPGRIQFSLRSLFLVTTVVAVVLAAGPGWGGFDWCWKLATLIYGFSVLFCPVVVAALLIFHRDVALRRRALAAGVVATAIVGSAPLVLLSTTGSVMIGELLIVAYVCWMPQVALILVIAGVSSIKP